MEKLLLKHFMKNTFSGNMKQENLIKMMTENRVTHFQMYIGIQSLIDRFGTKFANVYPTK